MFSIRGGHQCDVADLHARHLLQTLRSTRYGGGVAFQFAQVGSDQKAQAFLAKLDNDPQIGNLIDCTSNYEAVRAGQT